ncbi:unnamed protein product [Dovyalis caffra]|uniref:COBRA-like protein n=1 Tax=Dovyalis caffra TaxID=77055 RepID=A0AAV1RGK2_9ROSI|nr:unnamed protein product [Dovyalis caffra]
MSNSLYYNLLCHCILTQVAVINFSEAYDPLDPNGNITIKWDVLSWTPDGYVVVVTIYNYQRYRHTQAPGWSLVWTWAKDEVIWSMMGGQTTEQGDCFKLLQGGVINSWAQDPANAVSSFQLSVGSAGTSNKTVRLPRNITLKTPGPGYTCGLAKIVKPTTFITVDKRRVTQALNDTTMLWGIKSYNDVLMQAGRSGNVQLELLFRKDKAPTFTSQKGWAFPRRIYFNGDNCIMPIPWLPSVEFAILINLLPYSNNGFSVCQLQSQCPNGMTFSISLRSRCFFIISVSFCHF